MSNAETHAVKMCALTCCPCHLNLEKIKALAKNAKYICTACGRVAASADNLCQPQPMG